MSGAGEDLAQLMRRVLDREGFEAAVIAWDIVPAWNPDEAFCRWQETMDLHRFLAASDVLPPAWRQRAEQRHAELSERPVPAARRGPIRLAPHAVLPLCMEPMFEGLLIGDESAIRRALDVGGARVPDWPSRGWGDPAERRPDANLLGPAIHAVQNLPRKSRPAVCRQVRGDWIRNKDGWGELLLRRLLEDPQAMYQVKEHPISKRLREMLSP